MSPLNVKQEAAAAVVVVVELGVPVRDSALGGQPQGAEAEVREVRMEQQTVVAAEELRVLGRRTSAEGVGVPAAPVRQWS